ncbi:hypothetical protein Tco_0974023 [Tanacetum coccineum]|uniref:Uncharacterized protein n=1 Tax=Tanacetum coccineum TaxID=301880 RepID=A0ABQ5EAE7_9ASTR
MSAAITTTPRTSPPPAHPTEHHHHPRRHSCANGTISASGSAVNTRKVKLQLLGQAVPFSVCAVLIICISASCFATSRKLAYRDILTVSYPKIDYLLEEFSGELTHINLIPLGIKEANLDPEEEICLIEELLYDNLSPRPPKESNSEIS